MSRFTSSRRAFVCGAASAAASAALFSATKTASARASAAFDPSYGSAGAALAALRSGAISSRELVAHGFARIRKYNPQVNAFVTLLEERALSEAASADRARAQKRTLGALHGLPVLVKDAFHTAGVRTTGGSKTLAQHVPTEDAVVVARLKQAGAIIVGKTNVPEWSHDWQSFNAIAGQTNNPWDLTRTPGGSTGGGAAALASGMGFLEVGSDISGSIRLPSHFCGVYGHKPTLGLVPIWGHVTPAPYHLPPLTLPVVGPMARTPQDLQLLLGVLMGPSGDDALAYRVSLPKPRRARLRDYKVGFVLDDPYCPLDASVRQVAERAIERMRKAGVQLREGWPDGLDPAAAHDNYMFLMGVMESVSFTPERREQVAAWRKQGIDRPWIFGATATQVDCAAQLGRQLGNRAIWRRYFRDNDAFLLPGSFVPAFPHEHEPDVMKRTLATSAGSRPYVELSKLAAVASLSGCPATAIPAGRTAEGLPVGLQVMGPFLEDATPLDLAVKLADVLGGFVPPPKFA